MNIVMVGAGYVGLVTSACFAKFGHRVFCVDTDQNKINQLRDGIMPIYEPGLEELVVKNVQEGRLVFTTNLRACVPNGKAIFIAVGTPTSRRGDGFTDLQYVYTAARNIAKYLNAENYTVVINKSTVPIGTARQVARRIKEVNKSANFDVVSNPEFLREGAAIKDFTHPDRVVIGVESEQAEMVLRDIYRPLSLQEAPILCTDIESAEMIKYASNAFLAVKISFINEVANLCEQVEANVNDVARGIGMDNRIGSKFLHPGPGYGGSCFPKDTKAFSTTAREFGLHLRIVESAIEVNDTQKVRMIKKIRDAIGGSEFGKVIAVLGLAFKPETDDMRDAAALTILPVLLEKGARVRTHDPQAMNEAKKFLPDSVVYCKNAYDACVGADVVVILTEWNQYRALDLNKISECMNDNPVFIDLRNVYPPSQVRAFGFEYIGIGRK
ncbi:MAG: UDP-glucose 6-dehydrogenase [Candidatus Moraniibacteriota bacterium]|nr:MAG: UDP-glucose 6-dehydrogenase [Candidatus Moranbacteria bacterium]